MLRRIDFPKSVRRELQACGHEWSAVPRRNHIAIHIDGQLVTYVSRSNVGIRDERNLLADIRRFLRGKHVRWQ